MQISLFMMMSGRLLWLQLVEFECRVAAVGSLSKLTHSVFLRLSLPVVCRKSLHIFECLLFETDDLIMRKNEKHVILCLLEVARIGARFGMEAPMLVQMERQIDREIAADNKAMGISIGTETDKMSHSISVGTEGNLFDSDSEDEDNIAEEPLLVYGPQPQIITNDLKSLDEMVSTRGNVMLPLLAEDCGKRS